jgi:Chemotaxis phosphatase CheX
MSASPRADHSLRILAEVAEGFGFLTPLAPMPLLAQEQQDLVVEIAFSGSGSGHIVLACAASVATQLAANLLSGDPEADIAEEDLIQAIGELANITAGHLLVALAGNSAEFRLSPPRRIAPRDLRAGEPAIGLELMEGGLAVAVFAPESAA